VGDVVLVERELGDGLAAVAAAADVLAAGGAEVVLVAGVEDGLLVGVCGWRGRRLLGGGALGGDGRRGCREIGFGCCCHGCRCHQRWVIAIKKNSVTKYIDNYFYT